MDGARSELPMLLSDGVTRSLALAAVICVMISTSTLLAQDDAEAGIEAEALPSEQMELMIGVAVDYGRFLESSISVDENQDHYGGMVTARFYPVAHSRLDFEVGVNAYDRTYTVLGLGAAGGITQLLRAETRVDSSITYALDPLSFADAPVSLWTRLGWRHSAQLSSGFDHHISGALIGLNFEAPAGDVLLLHVDTDYTYNIVSLADSTRELGESRAGDALGSVRWGGGVQVIPSDTFRLGVGYRGEFIPYDHSDVTIHLVLFDARYSLRF